MNLDDSAPDYRYGAEVYVNGVKIQDEIVIRADQLNRRSSRLPSRWPR
jgi:hypothetical protein